MAEFNLLSKDEANYVEILLKDETVRTEAGAMRYMLGNLEMESKAPSVGGFFKSIMTGETAFKPTYKGTGKLVLEHSFKKRFGVTPKKYVKYLRLSRLRENLLNPDEVEGRTVIELASVYGFWHMGQLAADYRNVYGELPSDTLKRC